MNRSLMICSISALPAPAPDARGDTEEPEWTRKRRWRGLPSVLRYWTDASRALDSFACRLSRQPRSRANRATPCDAYQKTLRCVLYDQFHFRTDKAASAAGPTRRLADASYRSLFGLFRLLYQMHTKRLFFLVTKSQYTACRLSRNGKWLLPGSGVLAGPSHQGSEEGLPQRNWFWSAEALTRFEVNNAAVQRVRCRIEKVFGTWNRSYGLRRVCWLVLAKAGLQIRPAAMAYNLGRAATLLHWVWPALVDG